MKTEVIVCFRPDHDEVKPQTTAWNYQTHINSGKFNRDHIEWCLGYWRNQGISRNEWR